MVLVVPPPQYTTSGAKTPGSATTGTAVARAQGETAPGG